jgi:hypothetical protein
MSPCGSPIRIIKACGSPIRIIKACGSPIRMIKEGLQTLDVFHITRIMYLCMSVNIFDLYRVLMHVVSVYISFLLILILFKMQLSHYLEIFGCFTILLLASL